MSLFNNPVIMCGLIALGIVLILIIVVIICCKSSASKEREELKALSEEIEAESCDKFEDDVCDDKIENVLSKMQEALDTKEENAISFEQEQEENAIISYQELLNSLGAKSSIDVDSIELYDDELDGQIEISDFNKEIIDAYQNEDMSREFYKFQNDYSSENLALNVSEESPVMNFDFSMSDVEFVDDGDIVDCEEIEPQVVLQQENVYEYKHGAIDGSRKFKRTEIISPVYGIIKEGTTNTVDDIEEIIFDDDSLLDEF